MTEHYYSHQPETSHDERLVRVSLRGMSFAFWTDAGVFSKRGIDYGSQLLIEVMDIPQDATVLDMGCGYGPIGMVAARLARHGTVWLVDINERAVALAKRNLRLNGIVNAEVLWSDLYEAVKEERFDRILCNPPIRAGKQTVYQIFEGAVRHLEEQGELWVVMQKKQGAPSAKKKLESLFEDVRDMAHSKGYHVFRARHALPERGEES